VGTTADSRQYTLAKLQYLQWCGFCKSSQEVVFLCSPNLLNEKSFRHISPESEHYFRPATWCVQLLCRDIPAAPAFQHEWYLSNIPSQLDAPQEFFNYTSGRWISNEREQLEARRIIFSVEGLKSAAAKVLGVSNSFDMTKLGEGLFNRAFLLSNSDGADVVARLPTSVAGPKRLTTASEVATIKLMAALGIPVPKVFSYSCDAESEVGSEYILMERAKGIPLLSVWAKMGRKRRGQVMTQLVEFDSKLLAMKLSGYGSIYLKQDLPDSCTLPLSSDPSLSDYCLGPSVERSWWAEDRKMISIDRGPCKPFPIKLTEGTELNEILKAKALREIAWIEAYARPRPMDDLFRRSDSQEDPSAHIDLLRKYVTVIPLLTDYVAFPQPTLLHMDLHLGNIFIESAKQPIITAIIDWQGSEVLPLSLAARFPRMIDYDIGEDPVTVDMPPETEDPSAKADREAVMVKKYWLAKTFQLNPHLAAAFQEPVRKHLLSLWTESGRTWTGELAAFRHDLIQFVDICEQCPISFSPEERTRHKEELEEYNNKVVVMNRLREMLGVSLEGWVSPERFDTVSQANEELKRETANDLCNGNGGFRQEWERWWPFSDR